MKTKPRKITVDTNILISAVVFPGGAIAKIMDLVITRQCIIYVSDKIIEEFSDVMKRKFFRTGVFLDDDIDLIREIAVVVYPEETINVIKSDPSDNRILECAVESDSDVIISGDKHLLTLKKYRKIPIMTPADLLRKLMKQ